MTSDPLVDAYLEGNAVRPQHLVEFCFATQARRVSDARTTINAGGHLWFPNNKLASIEGLESDGNGQAQNLKFVFSGVDTRMLNIAKSADRSEYIGRPVKVFNRFVNDEWQQIGGLIARAGGIMDGLEISDERNGDARRRKITITATTIFYARSQASDSYYTNADQKRRYPVGGGGLQHQSGLKFTKIPFPW